LRKRPRWEFTVGSRRERLAAVGVLRRARCPAVSG
jgi:hypothetical protein